MPKPSELAKLLITGASFEDWDTVWVQHRWQQGWPLFRFSCAERAPLPDWYGLMQFKPGTPCQIFLGGILAITGIILQRQTTYDAMNHGVQLSGAGRQWASSTSSVKSVTGNFDNKSIEQVAREVLAPLGGVLRVIGVVDPTPFERLQANPGDLTFDFLDRAARQRGASIGSDKDGNTLLIGKHHFGVTQQLIEGQNILKMQCVFDNEQVSSEYYVKGQMAVADQVAARASAEMAARAPGSVLTVYKYLEMVIEQPVRSMAEMQMRASFEAIQREGTKVTAVVTVQGWLRDGLNLWTPGDNVYVHSPMAMLNFVMKIRTATFTQDTRAGTLTVLELVMPWALGDEEFGLKDTPAIPGAATTVSNEPPKLTGGERED